MDPTSVIPSFLVAALLGFLIGLERERKRELSGSIFAGVRTFTLIALLGAISGQLVEAAGPIIVLISFIVLGALLALAYWRSSAGEKIGGTTEVAALVALGLGVMAGLGEYVIALAGAVIVTAVLSLREELHGLAGSMTRDDLFAVVQFAALSIVILPLVPDESLGPWGVWNPRYIWLLVVLISGISFVGYVAAKVIGATRGIGVSGLLGGLASSTAVTLAFSERSRANHTLAPLLAVGVLAASAVTAPRLLVILGVIQPQLILPAMVPLGTLFVVTTAGGMWIHRASRRQPVEGAALANPFELKTAFQFAALFALILLLTRAAQEFLGEGGVYLASGIAGITQLDAITLALADQVGEGLDLGIAARGLAIAAACNNLFKSVLAIALGDRYFARSVVVTLTVAAAAAVAAAWYLVPLLPG